MGSRADGLLAVSPACRHRFATAGRRPFPWEIHTGRVRRQVPRYFRRRYLDDARRAEQTGRRSSRKGDVMRGIRPRRVVENRDDVDPGNADVCAAAEAVFRRAARAIGMIVRGSLSRRRHCRKIADALHCAGARSMSGDIRREAKQLGPAGSSQKQLVCGEHEKAHRYHPPCAGRTASPDPTLKSFHQRAVSYHVRKHGGKVQSECSLRPYRLRFTQPTASSVIVPGSRHSGVALRRQRPATRAKAGESRRFPPIERK